jgi:hypothetical protein
MEREVSIPTWRRAMDGLHWNQHQEAVDVTEAELGEAVQERIVSGMRESVAVAAIALEWGWDADEVAATFKRWKWGE